jgi:hypothetical protein
MVEFMISYAQKFTDCQNYLMGLQKSETQQSQQLVTVDRMACEQEVANWHEVDVAEVIMRRIECVSLRLDS